MKGLTVVFGHGTVGRLATALLLARGDAVRIAQRKRPADLSANAEFIACDILKPESVRQAVAGASQVLLSVGFPYDSRVWRRVWPTTMTNIVEACGAAGARVVFIDNLYQLGPQHEPRREDMALSNHGNKAAILSQVTRIWMDAKDRVKLAAASLHGFLRTGRYSVPSGSNRAWRVGEQASGNAAGAARYPARLCVCARYRARRTYAARRIRRCVRSGLEHAVRTDTHAA